MPLCSLVLRYYFKINAGNKERLESDANGLDLDRIHSYLGHNDIVSL